MSFHCFSFSHIILGGNNACVCVCVCVCVANSDYRLELFLDFSMHLNHLGCLLKYGYLDLSGAEKFESLISISGDTIGGWKPAIGELRAADFICYFFEVGLLIHFSTGPPTHI